MRLRAVTYNTWKGDGDYAARLPAMAAGLAALSPDLVLLQEALYAPQDGLDTAGRLAEACGLSLWRAPGRDKVRTAAGAMRRCRSDLALLYRGELLGAQILPLPPVKSDPDRVAFRAGLDLKGRRLDICGTHLSHLLDTSKQGFRAAQAAAFAEISRPEADRVVIAGGDLNAEWEAPDLCALAALPDLAPVASDDHAPTFLGEFKGLRTPIRRIDHLFVRTGPGIQAPKLARRTALNASFDAAGRFPSDHAAIVLDLDFGTDA